MWCRLAAAITLVLCAVANPVNGQAVQAIQGIRDVAAEEHRGRVDSVVIALAERLGLYRYVNTFLSAEPESMRFRDQLQALIQVGDRAIEARYDLREFGRYVNEFNRQEGALLSGRRDALNNLTISAVVQMGPLGLPVPQSHVLIRDVVFTIGPELFLSDGVKPIGAVGLSTNLLGAGVGAAFDILGATSLKEYFTQNLTAGAAIPFSGPGKLTAQVGLGLGGINLSQVTVWPVLNMESLDAEDRRVPSELLVSAPGEEQWSSSIVSLAIVPFSNAELAKRLRAGQFVPIPVVGLRAPFYYPGNAFSAVGAIFTEDRRRFARTGPVQIILGISIPLLSGSYLFKDL